MTLKRLTFRLLSVVEKEVTPRDWALGLAFGTWLGWQFGLNLQTVAGFLVIALVRGNLIGIAVSFIVAFVARDFTTEWANQIGYWILTHGASYRRLWAGLYHAPLIPFTFFYESNMMGRLLLGLISAVVAFFAAKTLVPKYGATIFYKIADGPIGRSLQRSSWHHGYLIFISRYGQPPSSHSLFRTKAPVFISAFLITAGAGFYAASPWLLETALTRYLSLVNGAPVKIGSVRLSLSKGELELNDIDVTHHVQTSKNLFEIDAIRANFEFWPLFSKKLIFRKVAIQGVQLDVAKRALEETSLSEVNDTPIPSLMDRVAVQFFNEARNDVKENPFRYLIALQKGLDLSSILRREKRTLASEGELKELLAATETLQKICQSEGLIRPTPKCQSDWEVLSRRYRAVDTVVKADVDRIKGRLGFNPVNATDLSRVLLGPRILQWLERLGYWLDFSRRRMGRSQDPREYTMVEEKGTNGKLIHFGKRSTQPSLLIEEITISSTARPHTQYGNVNGSLRGITNSPAVYAKPCEGEVEFDFPNSKFKKTVASLLVDHTAEIEKEIFTLRSEEMPLNAWAFYQATELYLGLQKAQASFEFDVTANGDSLAARGKMNLRPLAYEIRSPYKQLEAQLNQVFSTQNLIPIEFAVSGPPAQARLSLQSPFGVQVASALRDEFRQAQAAVEENLRREIEDHINGLRRALDARLNTNFSAFVDSLRTTASVK